MINWFKRFFRILEKRRYNDLKQAGRNFKQ